MSYDNFAKTFSQSRIGMKWPEIDYFFNTNINSNINFNLLDVGCGNGRLLEYIRKYGQNFNYLGIDESYEMIKEANKLYPESNFLNMDMLDIDKIKLEFSYIFFIASFHHLDTIDKRLEVLKKTKKLLKKDGIVFFTNWNLFFEKNFEKYKNVYRQNGDFEIKIGNFSRYYHAFESKELEDLFVKTNFEIIENRIFEGQRNIISVVR